MSLSFHPYFRDKQNAMQTAGLISAVANSSVGYTERAAAEGVSEPLPTLLVGSNWFFGGTINNSTGQTHTS
jgi:hypothetical protein